MKHKHSYLRAASAHGHHKVTFVELFFDLVFVFAITQLSHSLIEHFTPSNAAHTLLLTLAVWWVWIYTCWVTNWLDPEQIPLRLLLLVLTLAGLVASASIPQAFQSRGLAFAGAYVFMQVGRTLFFLWAVRGEEPRMTLNFQRILAWLALAGVFWIAGGVAEGSARVWLWTLALGLEMVSPSLGFWTPGLGRSRTEDWDVEGGHMAERCALFVMIALGESVLVSGATFSTLQWSWPTIAAFLVSLIGSMAMWWIYFDATVEAGSETIAHSRDPGRLARLAYTYIHLLLVAGIILSAVADEFVLAHPEGHTDLKTAIAVLGGAACYLVGNMLFKWAITGRLRHGYLVAVGVLGLGGFAVPVVAPLTLMTLATLVLVGIAVWDKQTSR